MPDRNPFEETMRAGMNVPQRTGRPFPHKTLRPDIGFDRAGQVRETNEMPRYTDTPTSRVNPIAGMNLYPQQRGYGVDPGLRRGAYEQWRNQGLDRAVPAGEQGIFGGGNLGADNIVNAILGGMNRSQQDAGFEVAGGPGMVEKRMLKKFWGTAVNKFPPGTANEILLRERDRLFNIWKKKAYTPGTGGGLLRFLKGIGTKGGGPLGIGMDLMPVEPALESIDQLYNPDPIVI